MRHGERQRGLGQIAQRRGDALQRPDAADIGDGGGQRDDPLGAPHRGGDPVAPGGGRDRRQLRHRRGDHRVRTRGDQRAQAGCLAHREVGEDRGCCRRASAAARRPPAAPPAVPRCGRSRRSARPAGPPRRRRAGSAKSSAGGIACRSCAERLAVRRLPGQAAIGCRHGCCTGWSRWRSRWRCWAASASRRSPGGCRRGRSIWPGSPRRLEEAANANGGPTRLAIGSAALAWEGFRMGVDRPLDLRLTNVTVIDQAGGRRMNIPRAEVSLSIYELLFGRVVPRAVTLDAPQLTLVRAADGTLSLDLGSLTEAADSGEPAPTAHGNTDRRPAGGVGAAGRQRSGTQAERAAGPAPSGAHPRCARRRGGSPARRHLAGAARGDRPDPAARKAAWTAPPSSAWRSAISRRG